MSHPPWDPTRIGFRPLTVEDLPLLQRWLVEPPVREWWDAGARSLEDLRREYLPVIEGREPTRAYVMVYDGRPVGYAQAYRIVDHPAYARAIGVDDPTTEGIDLYIGDPAYIHRGLGSLLLRELLGRVVFAQGDATACVVGPEPSNRRAIRAYEAVGFRHLRTVQVPGEPQPEYLMHITRARALRTAGKG